MGPHGLFWWIGAGVLIVAELTTGTFYLLMIAFGFIAGGLADMAGLRTGGQCAIAAVIALVSVFALWRSRLGKRSRNPDAARNPDVNLDIGETLAVDGWRNGRARAMYRGAQWDVQLAEGEPESAALYQIVALNGNCLVVAAKSRSESESESSSSSINHYH